MSPVYVAGLCHGHLGAVPQTGAADLRVRAVGATEEPAARLYPVPDDLASAVLADRGHGVYRALEAVEHVDRALRPHLERHVVVVTAHLTRGHRTLPSVSSVRSASCAQWW